MSYPAYPTPTGPPAGSANGQGTAALILGVVGLVLIPVGTVVFIVLAFAGFVCSIMAIVFGVLGKRAAREGRATNRGAAQAGFVLGIVGVVGGVLIVMLIVAFLALWVAAT